jgi:hypothetical protein
MGAARKWDVMRAKVLLRGLDDDVGSQRRPANGTWSAMASWLARHNTPLTIGAGLLAPILYLLYVNRYAVDVLHGDDWNMVSGGVHQALAGHFSLSQLWGQYGESRIFLVRVVFILFAFVDRLDTRSTIFFNAAVYIAAYAILLALCRAYFGRRLTPIPVLVLGFVWFSLADVQSTLWDFPMINYLLVLCFVVMVFALEVPKSRRKLWFSVGVVAAIMASMSFVSGFIVWPLGAICIVWARPRQRQAAAELAVWIAAACVTIVVYFLGFSWKATCLPALGCTPNAAISHPLSGLNFFVVLTGNVIPGGYFGAPYAPSSYARYEAAGVALCVVSLYILVQSWRERESSERFPLPLLLIGFGLLMNAEVALGRTGEGLFSAVNSNRYEFPNLVLLAGIVLYAWAHLPSRRTPLAVHAPAPVHRNWRAPMAWLSIVVLAVFLGIQVVVATQFGLTNGRLERGWLVEGARLAVNLNEVPVHERLCERAAYFIPTPTIIREAAEDHLGEFGPSARRYYLQLGPPALPLNC